MSRVGEADYDSASAIVRAAWDEEVRVRGRVTNMKRTLLLSEPAYAAYMGWYPLWDELVKSVGARAAAVFAHAISARNGCLLCTLYFRRELAEAGISPDAFNPSDDEALLMALAEAMAQNPGSPVSAALWSRLAARFSGPELVNVVGFAGMMIAVNTFNSTLGVELDKDLEAFLPSAASKPARERADG